jgi:hypothetical protein
LGNDAATIFHGITAPYCRPTSIHIFLAGPMGSRASRGPEADSGGSVLRQPIGVERSFEIGGREVALPHQEQIKRHPGVPKATATWERMSESEWSIL